MLMGTLTVTSKANTSGQLETVETELEMENGNGQNLMQMNARVKPLINDHLLKTTSVQRPHSN